MPLFLAGTVLVGVGCKDYDDDINDLKDQVSQLEDGKLASVEEQIAAIKSSITSLEGAYKAADAALQDGLDKQAAALAEAKATLQKSIDDLKASTTTDINKLKSDLTALSTKVDGINTKLAADIKKVADNLADNYTNTADMKAYVGAELGKLDAKITGEIAEIKTRMELAETAISGIQETIEEMKAQIADKVNQSEYDAFTQTTNEAIQKNAENLSLLQTLIGEFPEGESARTYIDKAIQDVTTIFEQFKEEYETFIAEFGEYKTDIETRLAAAEASILALEAFKTEMMGEEGTIANINAEIARLDNEKTTLTEVEALFEDGNNKFTSGVESILTRALAEGGIISEKLTTELNKLRDGYEGTLKELSDRIDVLAGVIADRIQSLVFVPTHTDGKIVFAKQYIEQGGTKIDLNTTAKTVATFRVTPASLASKLVEQAKAGEIVMSLMEEEIETRASKIKILDIVAGDAGKISLTLATEYDFAKKLAIALNIAAVPAEGDTMQGVEFSSAYVVTEAAADANVTTNLKVVKKDAEGVYTEVTTSNNSLELVYNSTATVNIFDNISIAYKLGSEYITLADAAEMMNWDVMPVMKTTSTAWTAFSTAANYTVAPANPLASVDVNKPVSVKLATGKEGVVDEYCQLTTTFSVTNADASKNVEILASAVSKVTIAKAPRAEITNANATVGWMYANYAATNSLYLKDVTLPSGKLTAAQFKAIDWDNVVWTVADKSAEVTGTVAVETKDSEASVPSTDTDAQIIRFNVKGYKNGNGTAKVSTSINIGAKEAIKISGVITFNGLPELTYTIPTLTNPTFDMSGAAVEVQVTDNLGEMLFVALPAGQTYFANKAEAIAFVATPLVVAGAAQTADAPTKTAGADLNLNAQVLKVQFVKNDIDFNAAASYTYTAPETAVMALDADGIKVSVKGSVTISKGQGYYLGQGSGIHTDAAVPYLIARGAVAANAYTVADIKLKEVAYGPQAPVGPTPVVTYSLVTTQPTGVSAMPTIDSGTSGTTGLLVWNDCSLDKVTIKAVMTVNSVVVDTKVFEVKLEQPIDFGAWGDFKVGTAQASTAEATYNAYTSMQGFTTPAASVTTYGKDIYNNILIGASALETLASHADGYGMVITFGDPTYAQNGAPLQETTRFSFAKATGILTVNGDNATLASPVTVTIPVTFTYKYAVTLDSADDTYKATKFTKNVTVTVTQK